MCLGWEQFVTEVVGLWVLGGVAVRSTDESSHSLLCEHHSLPREVNQKEGRSLEQNKLIKAEMYVGLLFPLNCLSHATYSFPGWLWPPNIVRSSPSLAGEVSVCSWFSHLSELSVESCGCSAQPIFTEGSAHRYHFSICREICFLFPIAPS